MVLSRAVHVWMCTLRDGRMAHVVTMSKKLTSLVSLNPHLSGVIVRLAGTKKTLKADVLNEVFHIKIPHYSK